jgi:uncharacterized membrane protein
VDPAQRDLLGHDDVRFASPRNGIRSSRVFVASSGSSCCSPGYRSGPALLHSRNGAFICACCIGLVSMATWFGITVVPLATATPSTSPRRCLPLWRRPGAARGREAAPLERVVLGFVGVLVIMRPGSARLDPNLLLLLLSAATAAMNNITVKFLVRSEPPSRIVAFFMIYLTPLSLIPALFVWQWPDPSTFGALIGLGCLGTIAHISVARALAAADASACAPFEFVRLPFAALIGFLWFGEVTDLWTWVGAAIIAVSSIYVAHREARLARLGRPGETRSTALSRR